MTTRSKIFLAAASVVAVAALIVLSVNGLRIWNDQQAEQARKDAVTAADRTVTAMFTYDYQTVDRELPKAADNLSPKFREDYLKLITQAIAPGAKDKQLSVKATTQAAGVVSADKSRVEVLLFLNQVTTSKDSPQGTTSGSRVRATVNKDGDRWLVDQVTPV
ncbi:h domain protein [Nocardia ninae]|uniref:Mammalian cell entry protein n=1 Tax=Nocardia ninae NBRC 108245 TaxID=1210091 RepID=A0A511MDB5_9NOCA|nr:h domain protein [Nocardia ninae]GEM38663.1 mammalian cell entry protein [Nocardia ninae NBRC 108245]